MKDGIAVVTGATGGIGRAVALLIAERSRGRLRLALHCRGNRAAAEELSRRIPGSFVVAADLASGEGRQALLDAVLAQGEPTVLVNSAGVDKPYEPGLLIREESFDRILAINLKAPLFLMKLFGKVMTGSGGGAIVNVSSALASQALAGCSVYRASKAALEALTKQFAFELGRGGVRVNAVAPGFVETPMTADVPEQVREGIRSGTALGRFATPETVAEAVWQLIDNESISGAVLPVDGGMNL
ncbi:MAG: SDR family NAD(P)-dependent oxidoreductase [Elusimicrobia bacterium]|nr:SDR family NAD(P)-dependent oxidoreductase [Elusimicrobiota bacterium]